MSYYSTEPSAVLAAHARIQASKPVGITSQMRKCDCCNMRRSIGQFVKDATTCIRCKRRGG